MDMMEVDTEDSWEHLPAELLRHIARLAAGSHGQLAVTKTRMRLTCSGWRTALPLGAPLG